MKIQVSEVSDKEVHRMGFKTVEDAQWFADLVGKIPELEKRIEAIEEGISDAKDTIRMMRQI